MERLAKRRHEVMDGYGRRGRGGRRSPVRDRDHRPAVVAATPFGGPLAPCIDNVEDTPTFKASLAAETLVLLDQFCASLAGDPSAGADLSRIRATVAMLAERAVGSGPAGSDKTGPRGLRAARTRAILAAIEARFAQPDLSARIVAAELGLSVRYVQELLTDARTTFAGSVLELRLSRALEMLADPAHAASRVSEIALHVGFNDISYFNRCFRRRFGAAPNRFR